MAMPNIRCPYCDAPAIPISEEDIWVFADETNLPEGKKRILTRRGRYHCTGCSELFVFEFAPTRTDDPKKGTPRA